MDIRDFAVYMSRTHNSRLDLSCMAAIMNYNAWLPFTGTCILI